MQRDSRDNSWEKVGGPKRAMGITMAIAIGIIIAIAEGISTCLPGKFGGLETPMGLARGRGIRLATRLEGTQRTQL